MKESVKSFTKVIAYVSAAAVILFASVIILAKLLTPELDKHHGEIEAWASGVLDAPVTIKKVRVSWFQYQPVISFDEVTALDKQTKHPIIQVQKIRVFFSIIDSIRQKKIVVTQIMLSGTDVNVTVNEKGEYKLQGFPLLGEVPGSDQPFEHDAEMKDVVGWLSQQKTNVVLSDVDIHYLPQVGTKRFVTLYNLRFENEGSKHVILGKAILHQKLATEVTVAGEWEGGADLSKIKANAYFYVVGLSASQWLADKSWHGWRIDDGMVNAKIWVTWENERLDRTQTLFEAHNLKLYSDTDKKSHVITRLSGDLGWRLDGDNQILAGDDIFIDLPGHLWPSTSFYLSYTPNKEGGIKPISIDIGYLDLVDVQTFLNASPPILSSAQKKLLSEMKLSGSAEGITANFADGLDRLDEMSISARLHKINFNQHNSIPGVKNLDAVITWSGNQGKLVLNAKNMLFKDDNVFANPILASQLKGEISIARQDNSKWFVETSSIKLINDDINLTAKGEVVVNESISTDISAEFSLLHANQVAQYLPQKIFSQDLNAWLKQAFLAGEVKSGTAILKGTLRDFPFDKPSDGLFQVKATVNNIKLQYAPTWPTIDKISATLDFIGRKIIIDVDAAETLTIPIGKIQGEIPNLGDPNGAVLTVNADQFDTDFSKALNYVNNSPLKETIGKMFVDAEGGGGVSLKLGLTVPLTNPDKTTVEGDLHLNNASLNFVPWRLQISKLNGQVHFTEKMTTAAGISGELFKNPLQLNLQTIAQQNNPSIVRAVVTTPLSIKDLESWLKLSFSNKVAGSTTVLANLDFSKNKPLTISLQSNLVGIAVNLDQPYAKPVNDPRSLSGTIIAEDKQPLKLTMKYGDQLAAGLLIGSKNSEFNLLGLDISLGDVAPTLPPGEGLYLSGNIPLLNWDILKQYQAKSGETSFTTLPLSGIDVDVATIELGGQTIKSAKLQLTPKDSGWNINLVSPDITGQIQLPKEIKPSGTIDAQFQTINLSSPNDSKKTDFSVDPKTLPTIHFSAKRVFYNGMPLGRVKFTLAPSGNGMAIKSLTANSRVFELEATGEWLLQGNSHKTTLKGSGESDNVTAFLERLGFDVHNFIVTTGSIDFDLKWDNAPYDLSLATMDGSVYMDLGKGRIVEIGDSNGAQMDLGRMLSLFSLQTIPRRLSLDFSDLFEKGYSFDYFRGNFKFEDGNAFTHNMKIDGPVANVDISGRIGLVAKDVDLTMDVTPHVTSSIPVAATLLTGQPVIGLAALAVNTVIGSQVSKATSHLYTVTGSWTNPQWGTVMPHTKNH